MSINDAANKQYYSSDAPMPEVRSDTVLVHNNNTFGFVTLSRDLTDDELTLLNGSQHRLLHTLRTIRNRQRIGANTEQEGYDKQDVFNMLHFVRRITRTGFTFADKGYTDIDTVKSVARGIPTLLNLSIFDEGGPIVPTNINIVFRLDDTSIVKIFGSGSRTKLQNGWYVPVWSEKTFYPV